MKGDRVDHSPRLLRGRLLSGANVHHHTTVFVQPFVPGPLASVDSHELVPEFAARFAARFGGDALGGPARPALLDQPPFSLVAALLEAALAIERHLARTMRRLEAPTFARIVERRGRLELVWESWSGAMSRAAARTALAGLLELLPANLAGGSPARSDFAKQLGRLRHRAWRYQWSTTAATIAMVARQRGLRYEVLAGSYVRIGDGVQQQMVSLSSLGMGPRPLRGHQPTGPGRLVADAGTLHRLLVVNGVLVSALRCDPPRIVGDGSKTVGRWIADLNQAPTRSGPALRRIPVDATLTNALAERGLRLDDVPSSGQLVELGGAATPERGAAVADVTTTVHDDVRRAALLAAAEHPGPVTGIEYLTDDVGRGGSGVATVSAAPELHLHALPENDRGREVGDALLGAIFADAPATLPTVFLVGERGTSSVARGLERFLRASHAGVALAMPGHASVGGVPLERTAHGPHPGPAFLLGDPRTELLVATVSPRRVVERGLGLDRCRVVAILGSADEPPSGAYRAAVAVGLAAAQDAVVVGADNPLLEQILAVLAPARAFVAARRRAHPVVPRLLAAGCAVVRPSENRAAIELQRGNDIVASIPIAALRVVEANAFGRGRCPALYAAALAFALGSSGDRSRSPRDHQHPAPQPG